MLIRFPGTWKQVFGNNNERIQGCGEWMTTDKKDTMIGFE